MVTTDSQPVNESGSKATRLLLLPERDHPISVQFDSGRKTFQKSAGIGTQHEARFGHGQNEFSRDFDAKKKKKRSYPFATEAKKLDSHGMLTAQIKMMQQQLKKI